MVDEGAEESTDKTNNIIPFPRREAPPTDREQKEYLTAKLREGFYQRFFEFIGDNEEGLSEKLAEWKTKEKDNLEIRFRTGRDVLLETDDISSESAVANAEIIDSLKLSDLAAFARIQVVRQERNMDSAPDQGMARVYEEQRRSWLNRLQSVEKALADQNPSPAK